MKVLTIYPKANLLHSNSEALVNPINCVGAMGKGLAAQFKLLYPSLYIDYKQACRRGDIQIGRIWIYEINPPTPHRYILGFPTKDDWRFDSKLEYISAGLAALTETIVNLDIKSIGLPKLGCGQGNLDWGEVKKLILEEVYKPEWSKTEVVIYE